MSLNTREHVIPMVFNGGENPPKLPLTMGGSRPPSNTWLLGLTAPDMPNAISTEPAVSSVLTLHYPYTLLWDGPFPTQNGPFPWGDLDPHLIHGDCRPPHPTCQTASRSVQPFCHNASSWPTTDRQTDRPTMNMAKYKSHLYTTHIRCGLKRKSNCHYLENYLIMSFCFSII